MLKVNPLLQYEENKPYSYGSVMAVIISAAWSYSVLLITSEERKEKSRRFSQAAGNSATPGKHLASQRLCR